jgi:hypothetical protein
VSTSKSLSNKMLIKIVWKNNHSNEWKKHITEYRR